MPSASNVLNVKEIFSEDELGCQISNFWHTWDQGRAQKVAAWKELRKYIYATDTTSTTNSTLPWKNTTTVPKMTQIRDNLYANYMASMFPNPRWMEWQGATEEEESRGKAQAAKSYMKYVVEYKEFKNVFDQLVLDYIDYGNCFVYPGWEDERMEVDGKVKTGYVGPVPIRISPLDIVFPPTAVSFAKAPKIVRSLVSLGEIKEILEQLGSYQEGEQEGYEQLYHYLKDIRHQVNQFAGELTVQDEFYTVDGFTSFRHYLESDYAEILTFYGDVYDKENDTFLKNHIVQVVDRHKVFRKEPHPSHFGTDQIVHVGWRPRQDNLWAMGPLDNLVGMQYRIDHIENLKADLFDLTAFPPLKVKGFVQDFDWAPFEKIVTSEEGDVEIMQVNVNPLQANFEIDRLEAQMEEMAGAPKEAMGFRTPGEKTKYEVQRLENAAARVFQNKIRRFEEQILEPLLNAMLELGRRQAPETAVRILDDDFQVASFLKISPEDLAGSGRIIPIAAKHFAEKAERVQNISNFYQTVLAADPELKMHFSSVEMAKLMEDLLELPTYKLVTPFVRLSEQTKAQQMQMQGQEETMMTMAPEEELTGGQMPMPSVPGENEGSL